MKLKIPGKSSNIAEPKTDSGFSLAELMVVLGLLTFLGIGTAATLDIHSWLASYRLRASARQIFLDMQKIRLRAVNDNRDWAIRFDPDISSYSFEYKDSGGNWVDTGESRKLETGIRFGADSATFDATDAKKPFDPADDYVTFTGARITFNSLGLPTKSGYCYICSEHGNAYAIGTNNCGVIKMKRWHDNDWGS